MSDLRHCFRFQGATLYFSRLNKRRPKPVKRPRHWARNHEQLVLFGQLCSVAAEVPRIMVDCSRGVLLGTMGWPDPDTMRFTFAPSDPEIEPPFPDEALHFIAESRDFRYAFTTRIHDIDPMGRWILDCPEFIENEDRRSCPRYRLHSWKTILRRQGTMGEDIRGRVHDLSVGGLSMIVSRDGYRLRPEQPLVGLLLGPHGERLPLRASIRHVVPWDITETPRLFIGSCFEGFGVVNHARLAKLLAGRRTTDSDGTP